MALVIGRCEGCEKPIRRGDRYSHDRANAIDLCFDCTPTFGDMLDTPESFYGADDEYHTAASAKAVVDAHLAAGGSLNDKVGLVDPNPVNGANGDEAIEQSAQRVALRDAGKSGATH